MFAHPHKIIDAVRNGLQKQRVLVIGDLMLDRYLWGRVQRISPEAPVPVVRIDHTTDSPGGAANVARNLRSLGCQVSIAGALGDDQQGQHLLDILQGAGVEIQSVVSVPGRPTITKTRILGGQQQMLRLDVEQTGNLSSEVYDLLLSRIGKLHGVSTVVLSDYGKGVLSEAICRAVILRAREHSIPVFVDPKGFNYEKYAGCHAISPNRTELAAVTATDSADLDELFAKGERLRSELSISHLMITLGELGIALVDSRGIRRFPAQCREVFDVSGAGDTVIATVAAATAAGIEFDEAIHLANLAAGLVISKIGTAPINKDELIAALAPENEAKGQQKICSQEELSQLVARWRLAGRRIVLTNGCFDLLHAGHLTLLEQARREGDCLIVALNSDRSVRRIKGAGRPILSEGARAKLLAALPCVDAVMLFDEETPLNIIRAVQPNVVAKGANYLEEEVVGSNEIEAWGGKVAIIPFIEESETEAVLKRATANLHDDSDNLVQ